MTKLRANRLNGLASINNAKQYLEIGVNRGITLNLVSVENKVGVDPCFRFDLESNSSGAELFKCTSDEYFDSSRSDGHIFDLIYLDGLHEFNQTFRDFCNSLMFSHDNTIWLIDDTNPNSYEASLSSQKLAKDLRKSTGMTDNSWMGDVYKTIFAINRYFSCFSYATFRGHGQTVVWKKQSSNCSIDRVNANLDISSLDYAQFISHRDSVMNFIDDSAIYDLVKQNFQASNLTRSVA